MIKQLIAAGALLVLMSAEKPQTPNTLTDKEKKEGMDRPAE